MAGELDLIERRFISYGFSQKEYDLMVFLRRFFQSISGHKLAFYEHSGQFYIMPEIMRSDRFYLFQLDSNIKRISAEIGDKESNSSSNIVPEHIADIFRELVNNNSENIEWTPVGWIQFVKDIQSSLGLNPGVPFSYPDHIAQKDAEMENFRIQLRALAEFSAKFDSGKVIDKGPFITQENLRIITGMKVGTFRRYYYFDKFEDSVKSLVELSSIIGRLLEALEKKAPRGSIELEIKPLILADNASEQDFWSMLGSFFSARPEIIRNASLFEPAKPTQQVVQAQMRDKAVAQAAPIIKKLGETRLSETRSDSSRKIEEFMKELIELAPVFNGTDPNLYIVLGELFREYNLIENLKILFEKNPSDRFFAFKEITYRLTLQDLKDIISVLGTIMDLVSNPEWTSFGQVNKGIGDVKANFKQNEQVKDSFKRFESFGKLDGEFSVFTHHFLPFLVNNIYYSKAEDKDVKLAYLYDKFHFLREKIMKAP